MPIYSLLKLLTNKWFLGNVIPHILISFFKLENSKKLSSGGIRKIQAQHFHGWNQARTMKLVDWLKDPQLVCEHAETTSQFFTVLCSLFHTAARAGTMFLTVRVTVKLEWQTAGGTQELKVAHFSSSNHSAKESQEHTRTQVSCHIHNLCPPHAAALFWSTINQSDLQFATHRPRCITSPFFLWSLGVAMFKWESTTNQALALLSGIGECSQVWSTFPFVHEGRERHILVQKWTCKMFIFLSKYSYKYL